MSEIDNLIRFWEAALSQGRLLMNPSTIVLVEQTIKALEELKKIKEAK
ncbi:hypothetical protein ES705_35465 [subsurface metagenome]